MGRMSRAAQEIDSQMQTGSHKNEWLDLCRALAIGLVLMSHGRHFLFPLFPGMQHAKFGGFLGVELFFVLSGYLIGGILLQSMESRGPWLKRFWLRRWARTLPAYWAFLLVNLLLALLAIRNADISPTTFLQYLTFTQNAISTHPGFMGEAWSLSAEEIFYFLMPILIATFGLHFSGKTRYLMAATALMAGSFIARTAVTIFQDPLFDEGIRKISLLRLDAISAGLLLAYAHRYNAFQARTWSWIHLVGIACFVMAAILAALPDPEINRSIGLKLAIFPFASVGAGALISAGLHLRLARVPRIVTSALADVSYSAYLANLPVFFLLVWLCGMPTSPAAGVGMWLAFMLVTYGLAKASRELIEKPALAWRERSALM